MNTLYYGDNLDVLREKIDSLTVDLIYLDPPFNSNRNYFVLFNDRTGKASAAQEEAFTDTWTWTEDSELHYKELVIGCPNRELATLIQVLRSFLRETPMMAYLVAMSIRLLELHRVLKSTGSLYLHCDPTASHYLKIVLDAIFGTQNYRSEITWLRSRNPKGSQHGAKKYSPDTDIIFYYAKSKAARLYYENIKTTLPDALVAVKYDRKDEKGAFTDGPILRSPSMGNRPNLVYEYKGYVPGPYGWRVNIEKLREIDEAGDLGWTSNGHPYRKLRPETDTGDPIGSCWTDISSINPQAAERLGYPTQKPLALLERIINASSNPDDLVLDPFCGCGTTVTAAHKLHRQWIGIDITAVAVGVIKTRLEQAFPDLRGKVVIDGFPRDLESAQTLFEQDAYKFQVWACTLINAYPLTKKGADSGVDGWLNFLDLDDSAHRAVVQVKGGKVGVSQVRDFCHVVTREKATLGFFLCMSEVTKPMRDEALKEGLWTSAGGHEYPRIQILTVADALHHVVIPRYPPQDKASMLGYKATQQQRHGTQKVLFHD